MRWPAAPCGKRPHTHARLRYSSVGLLTRSPYLGNVTPAYLSGKLGFILYHAFAPTTWDGAAEFPSGLLHPRVRPPVGCD
ncbi:MAG: hypothetical protein H6Q07_1766 [Acidobacteria bacterium]|nr:hypothetical protein [Acidobacteriota bacterium]